MIHEVMKLVVKMKLHTNGNKQVESVSNMPGMARNNRAFYYKATFLAYK